MLTKSKNRGFHVSNGPYVIMDMVYDLFEAERTLSVTNWLGHTLRRGRRVGRGRADSIWRLVTLRKKRRKERNAESNFEKRENMNYSYNGIP